MGAFPQGNKLSNENHYALFQQTIEWQQGQVFKIVGISFQASFASPVDALIASIDAQRALSNPDWGEPGSIQVRMGLHIGSVDAGESDYQPNHTLNRAARLMSAGHGGKSCFLSPSLNWCVSISLWESS